MPESKTPIKTTVVGSMKKPSYLKIPSWSENTEFGWGKKNPALAANGAVTNATKRQEELEKELLEKQIIQATEEVIAFQSEIGVDVVTDGEMRRNNYIYPFLNTLTGFDFENQQERTVRNGKWTGNLPRVVGEVSLKPESERADMSVEWRLAQDVSDVPVKYTIPGPLTIADSVANCFYKTDAEFTSALAPLINHTILTLVKQGCKYIQVDEPVLARYPHKAEAAIKNVEVCLQGVPEDVTTIVHVCCGYPQYLDQEDYEKAELSAYLDIAKYLNESSIQQVSLEDAHRRNTHRLFEKLDKKTVILGCIDVARSRVESVEEIQKHIEDVLQYVPRERLVVAPDCGLIMLPDDVMRQKMKNMTAAARKV